MSPESSLEVRQVLIEPNAEFSDHSEPLVGERRFQRLKPPYQLKICSFIAGAILTCVLKSRPRKRLEPAVRLDGGKGKLGLGPGSLSECGSHAIGVASGADMVECVVRRRCSG